LSAEECFQRDRERGACDEGAVQFARLPSAPARAPPPPALYLPGRQPLPHHHPSHHARAHASPDTPQILQVRDLRARVAAADAAAAAANASPTTPTTTKPRRPPTEPAYDAAAWRAAADELRAQPTLSDALRAVYEDVLALFPTAAQLWARWVELELSGAAAGAGGPDAAKRLFARCLVSCPTAELYGLYIKCIRRANEPRGVEALAETRAAFEHALSAAGQDAGAGPLWLEYLSWLQAPKPGTPEYLALFSTGLVGGDEDSERARAVR
jgi:cleavage stimulation factor subunit 3